MFTLTNSTFTQPLDILVGIFICLCFLNITTFLSYKIKIHENNKLNFSIIYLILTFSLAQFFFFISLFFYDLILFRYIILLSCFAVFFLTKNNFFIFFQKEVLKNLKKKKKIIAILIILSLFLLTLIPASDIDSLDYHLGLATNIINNGIYRPDFYWIHSRVVGLGEFINLIGITTGSKNFGSIYQFSSILVLIKILHYYVQQHNSKVNYYYLIISCPLIFTFLIFQKIQLVPSIAIFLSIVLICENLLLKNIKIICSIFSLLFFTITFKYSFLINVFSVFTVLFILNFQNKNFYKLLIYAIPLFLIITFPHLLKNYIFFQDPITPFLESFKTQPDLIIKRFSETLKSDTYSDFMTFDFKTMVLFPVFLSFSLQPHFFNHLHGLAIITIYYFIFSKKTYSNKYTKFLILYILLDGFIYMFVAKQLTPRYYIDIYLITGILIIYYFNDLKRFFLFKILYKLIKLQSIVVFLFAIVVILKFLPGSLHPKMYDKMMLKIADGYAEAKWVDKNLPLNSIYISENSRSHSLFPRKFISIRQLMDYDNFDILELIKKENVSHAVVSYPVENNHIKKIINNCNYKIIDKNRFERGLRNPISKFKSIYNLMVIEIKC